MKMFCREDCEYRNRYAPFCGYCLIEILRKEKSNNDIEEKTYSFGETDIVWSGYRKENIGSYD